MSSLLLNDKEAAELMLRMRTLINLEFKILLNFTEEEEIEEKLCAYGFKSQSPDLLKKAKQLAKLSDIPLPNVPEGINNILELLASNRLTQPSRIAAAGVPAFVIDKARKKFWSASTLKRLDKLDTISVNFIQIQPLSADDMLDLEQNQRLFQTSIGQTIPMHPLPLEEFFWFASARFSHGQLLKGLNMLKLIRLTRWPEICRQSDYRAYTRMAIKLMQHPVSINEIIQTQGVNNETETILFLNACYLCGWLVESDKPLMKQADDKNKKTKLNFISRIRARLGIGKK